MIQPERERPSEFATQTVQGTLWSYLSFALGKGLVFLTTMILARLLAPQQFGQVGFCLIAMQYLDILNRVGLDGALIARRDKVEAAANAAFAVNLAAGLLCFGLAWAAAPGLAGLFNDETVTSLFRAIAVVIPIMALGIVPHAVIQRNLRFKSRLIVSTSSNAAKGLTSILLAWHGFGAWSLIWGQIAGELTGTALAWWLAGWRPTPVFEWQVTKEMLIFGGHIVSVGIISALASNGDYLLIGRFLGAAQLGYYTLAYRIPELAVHSMDDIVARVAYSLLSKLQPSPEQLRPVYFGYIRYTALFAFPAGLGLALIASPFITTFYTARWAPSIPVMSVIALAFAIKSVDYVPGVLFKSISRPDILNKISLFTIPVFMGTLWYSTRWGIVGVAFGQLAMACFYFLLDAVVINRILRFRVGEMFAALAPALIASSVMGLAVVAVQWLLSPTGVAGVALPIVVGAAAYGGALAVVSRDTVARAGIALRAAITRS